MNDLMNELMSMMNLLLSTDFVPGGSRSSYVFPFGVSMVCQLLLHGIQDGFGHLIGRERYQVETNEMYNRRTVMRLEKQITNRQMLLQFQLKRIFRSFNASQ